MNPRLAVLREVAFRAVSANLRTATTTGHAWPPVFFCDGPSGRRAFGVQRTHFSSGERMAAFASSVLPALVKRAAAEACALIVYAAPERLAEQAWPFALHDDVTPLSSARESAVVYLCARDELHVFAAPISTDAQGRLQAGEFAPVGTESQAVRSLGSALLSLFK